MALTTSSNRVVATGDNSTTRFYFNRLLYDGTHLQVYLNAALQSSGYTVGGIADPWTANYVDFAVAPGTGVQVLLLRVVPLTQLSVYAVAGAFPAKTTEKNFDLAVMALQQFDDRIERSIRQPEGDVANIDRLPVKVDRASKYLAFDADGDPIATSGTTSSYVVTPFMETVLDDTTAAVARATLGSGATGDSVFTASTAAAIRAILGFADTGFTTGDVKMTLKIIVDSGWVFMDDKSIGDATSGATGRANADTSDLYTLIWTNIVDQWAPVTGGRGGSAAADFAAHKPLALPKTLGRALAGYGVGTTKASGVNADVDTTLDTLTVASNNTTWITGMPVVFTLSSGTITGLTSSTTYYVIRSTATAVKLATTLANAQNGTAIDLTAKSSPVWTITYTFTSRAIGEQVGEDAHAQSVTELLAHTHGTVRVPGGLASVLGGIDNIDQTGSTASTGGNVAMNIMQPTIYLNVMCKL